jgi:hypothetical protein
VIAGGFVMVFTVRFWFSLFGVGNERHIAGKRNEKKNNQNVEP